MYTITLINIVTLLSDSYKRDIICLPIVAAVFFSAKKLPIKIHSGRSLLEAWRKLLGEAKLRRHLDDLVYV